MPAAIRCALILAVLSTAACHTLKPVSIDQARASHRVWLTLSDRSVVVVDGPQIYGDKVVGFVNGKYVELVAADLKQVQVRESARGRTAAVVAASVLVVGGFAAWGLSTLGTHGGHAPDMCDLDPNDELCG